MSSWVAHCGTRATVGEELSPGLELDVLDGDAVESELEAMDGAHDGGVEAAGTQGPRLNRLAALDESLDVWEATRV